MYKTRNWKFYLFKSSAHSVMESIIANYRTMNYHGKMQESKYILALNASWLHRTKLDDKFDVLFIKLE